nr:hypothetical protein [Tanacetum cinerariifolium]
MVAKDDETSKDKDIDKLMALISLSIGNVVGARETVGLTMVQKSGIQCYNCKEFGHVARECQKPKRAKDAAYHREKMLLYQELEAHHMYMAQLQKVSPDAADSGPIFDDEPLQKVSNDDHYNVFPIESKHLEKSKFVHDTYPIENDAQNVIIDSLDMSYNREEIDQNDDDNDLAKERELLASLIEKLKCEIDESKNQAVQIILTGINNDIYSTVDAFPNACEMWKAVERLKQGESINVQDLETNLFWEFGKFTSLDGESLESSYSRMAEIVTLVKQSQELKHVSYHKLYDLLKQHRHEIVSYHKLYDILKQHQYDVNEIRVERIARVANPLALVAQQQPVYHLQNHPTHYTQNSSTKSQQAATRNKGKAIFNSLQPIYDQEPSMVIEDDETSKDKEIDKLMALIFLSFKKIYKPTNNNLRTSSNTSRANHDNSPRIKEVLARECQKPKRAKDAAYHREKMLLCKQEEAGIQLNAEQADWRDDTDDDELEDQELEAHYMYMAQLQEISPDAADSGPIFDDEPL